MSCAQVTIFSVGNALFQHLLDILEILLQFLFVISALNNEIICGGNILGRSDSRNWPILHRLLHLYRNMIYWALISFRADKTDRN